MNTGKKIKLATGTGIVPVVSTVMSSVELFTEQEKRELVDLHRKQWLARTIDTLFALAEYDQEFAEDLCKRFADFFGPDDKLGPLILKRINADRVGKPTKKPSKWKWTDYWFLLEHYYGYRRDGATSEEAARKISRVMEIANPAEAQKKRLGEAKKVPGVLDHLTPEVRKFMEGDTGHRRKQKGG